MQCVVLLDSDLNKSTVKYLWDSWETLNIDWIVDDVKGFWKI